MHSDATAAAEAVVRLAARHIPSTSALRASIAVPGTSDNEGFVDAKTQVISIAARIPAGGVALLHFPIHAC